MNDFNHKIIIMKRALILLVTICLQISAISQNRLYVGTFAERGSEGIYVLEWNPEDASTKILQTMDLLDSPSFLAFHPSGKYLYSANRESIMEDEPKWGSVASFKIGKDGKLSEHQVTSTYGQGACHVSLDATGQMLFAANYSGSNFMMIPTNENGELMNDGGLKVFDFKGKGTNVKRQEKPHPHAVIISPDNRFAYVTDLGTDKVYAFRLKPKRQKIKPAKISFTKTKAGSGPRHFTFHPNGRFAFIAEELSSEVSMFRYFSRNGRLEFMQRLSTLPSDFADYNSVADIHIHPNGRWMYISNRGHESLVIYEIDQQKEQMILVGHENVRGWASSKFYD